MPAGRDFLKTAVSHVFFAASPAACKWDGGRTCILQCRSYPSFGQAECVEEIREPVEDIDLEKAEIVIGGGNGLGGRENFELLRELAIRLGGAVAATRPVIEAGWAPRNRQVGQSGKSISPELYLAFGISGASQHISGMINAKYVVASTRMPRLLSFNMPITESWETSMKYFQNCYRI